MLFCSDELKITSSSCGDQYSERILSWDHIDGIDTYYREYFRVYDYIVTHEYDWNDICYLQVRIIIHFILSLESNCSINESGLNIFIKIISISRAFIFISFLNLTFSKLIVLCFNMKIQKSHHFRYNMLYQKVFWNHLKIFNFLTIISISKNTLSSSVEFLTSGIISTIRYFDYLHLKLISKSVANLMSSKRMSSSISSSNIFSKLNWKIKADRTEK